MRVFFTHSQWRRFLTFVLNKELEENAMQKAKDDRIKITAAFFRVSFDEEDSEKEDEKEASPIKESKKTISQASDDGLIKVRKKSSIPKAEISSNLATSDPEFSPSTSYVQSCASKHLQSSSLNNADEHSMLDNNISRKNYNKDSEAIAKIETQRLTVPMADSDKAFSEHTTSIAKDSSAGFQLSPIEEASTHTKSISIDKSRHSELTSNCLEISPETSEFSEYKFRFPKLSEQSTGENTHSDIRKVRKSVPRPSLTTTAQDNLNEISSKNGSRRSTLPMTSADLSQSAFQEKNTPSTQKFPAFEDILAGTSVNPIRKFSIANAAICSSLAPSLLGAIPGVPNSLLPNGDHRDGNLHRSATLSNLSIASTAISDDTSIGRTRRGLKSFLRLHIPTSHPDTIWHNEDYHHHLHHHYQHDHHHHDHHHMFPHIHVPTITFTAPATDGIGRKFNFAIRRHSNAVSVNSRRCTSFLFLHYRFS